MNRKVNRIDQQGLYIEDVILRDDQPIPDDCTETPAPEGLYHPKYDKETDTWTEGKTAAQIAAIKAAHPAPIDADAELAKNIAAAQTLEELKAALLGSIGSAKVKGSQK